jgi:membrane protein DedA with SNARE-associated domain
VSSLPIVETVVGLIKFVMEVGGLPALVALMTVESFGISPLPSEIILPFAGLLVWEGHYPFAAAVAAALLGGVLGAYASYAVGRWGRGWLTRAGSGVLRLNPKHLAAMDEWFARKGESTVLVSRLLPIVRSYISYPAGTARMNPTRFGVYTAVGALPFTAALIYAGVLLGPGWEVIVPYFEYADYAGAAVIAGLLVYILLRWRGVITRGFPPQLTRSSARPRPEGDAPP